MSYDTANYKEVLSRHDFVDTSDWMPIEHVPEWMRITGKKAKVPQPEFPPPKKVIIVSKEKKEVAPKKIPIKRKISMEEYREIRKQQNKIWFNSLPEEKRKEFHRRKRTKYPEIGLTNCAEILGISPNLLRAICETLQIQKRTGKSWRFGIRKINELKEYLSLQILDSNNTMV